MTLIVRALNRATLQRQMLLRREPVSALEAVEKLAGLQAQYSPAPYVALWTRLEHFAYEDLMSLLENRSVVKATGLRGTLHLFSAADFPFYNTLTPDINTPKRYMDVIAKGIDVDTLREKIRAFMVESPRLREEVEVHLMQFLVGPDEETLRRIFPIMSTRGDFVHVPPSGFWRYHGKIRFVDARQWLGQSVMVDKPEAIAFILKRYFAAFGPAALADAAEWCGLTVGAIKPALASLELIELRDENKRVLYDLPDAPLPDAETPAPVRFLAPFDNVLLSYKVRDRILPEDYRKLVVTKNLQVLATFLLDGFVAGTWSTERKKDKALLTLKPFRELTSDEATALQQEGEVLVRFMEPEAAHFDITIQKV